MNKERIKTLALALFLIFSGFALFGYTGWLKTRSLLQSDLQKTREEVLSLTKEKQNLLQELGKEKVSNKNLTEKNARLKAYVKAGRDRLRRLFREKSGMQDELKAVKAQNEALVTIQKSIYAGSGLPSSSGSRINPQKVLKEKQSVKNSNSGVPAGENRGFLVKDGQSGKVKIEVLPVKSKEE
ncbi:MAG: hypothetical protein PHX28_00985 [Candidatus Omnitrophica bacterium]|nr:hypothetical protein [Candidatus Omnitrophota bacterium]